MRMIKFRNYFFVLTLLFSDSCSVSKKVQVKGSLNSQTTKYELVKDWPELPLNFSLSQVSGIGIDNSQNIFLLQRTGRKWLDTLPDSLISSNTIFLLDKGTGKVLNRWGANIFIMPHGLSVDKENNVWVTDVGLHQVFKFDHNGRLLLTLGEARIAGDDRAHFNLPTDVAIANDGSFYVGDGYGNSRIVKFSKEGQYLFAWGKRGTGQSEFNNPHSLCLDSHGNVLVADRENQRIQKFDSKGNFIKEWKNNLAREVFALSVDRSGDIFAVDETDKKDSLPNIIRLDSELNFKSRSLQIDLKLNSSDWFHDIAVDHDGCVYIANLDVKKILKYKPVTRR
jgi:peptidylamidoglycolate lyase